MLGCGDEEYKQVLEYTTGRESQFVSLKKAEYFRTTMPKGVLTGDYPRRRGVWKDGVGWVFARAALEAVHAEAKRLGVEFVAGRRRGKSKRCSTQTTDPLSWVQGLRME